MKKFISLAILAAIAIYSTFLVNTAEATTYTLAQVQAHNNSSDCWTIIDNQVYNLTDYINLHPGGANNILGLCGIDGSVAFYNMHNGNTTAINQLSDYYIGDFNDGDITPPSEPSSLLAAPLSASQINLSWTSPTDNIAVAGYKIFRDNIEIGNTSLTSYQDLGLSASTTYTYFVKAYDQAGNVSTSSNSISTSTLADEISPTIPTNLIANAVSANQINLSWTSSTDNIAVAGYKIFRDNIEIDTTSLQYYYDSVLSTSTTYTYFVKAYDQADNVSTSSNSATATTLATSTPDNTAPSSPNSLLATTISDSQINLSWDAASDNIAVAGYKIFRDNIEIGNTNLTSYQNLGLSASTTYTYFVKAYDQAGNVSTSSNSDTATTLPTPVDNNPEISITLKSLVTSYKHVNLQWLVSNADDIIGYRIYRDGKLITETSHNKFNDKNLQAATTYTYYIIGFNSDDEDLTQSNTITVTTRSNNGRYDEEDDEEDDNHKYKEDDDDYNKSNKFNKFQEKVSKEIVKIKNKAHKESHEKKSHDD